MSLLPFARSSTVTTDPFSSLYGPGNEVWNRSPGDVFQQFDRMWPTSSTWMGPDGQVQSLCFDLVEHGDRFVFMAGENHSSFGTER
jgi:hypothetical protein